MWLVLKTFSSTLPATNPKQNQNPFRKSWIVLIHQKLPTFSVKTCLEAYSFILFVQNLLGGEWFYEHLVYMSNFKVFYLQEYQWTKPGRRRDESHNSSFRSRKFIRPTSLAHCHAVHYALFTIHRMVFGKNEVIIQLRPILFWYSIRTPDSPTPTVNRWAQHNTYDTRYRVCLHRT